MEDSNRQQFLPDAMINLQLEYVAQRKVIPRWIPSAIVVKTPTTSGPSGDSCGRMGGPREVHTQVTKFYSCLL